MKHGFSAAAKKREPDREMMGRVRAALILRGSTLAGWADGRGVSRGSLHNAISGRRQGVRSRALRAELLAALGLSGEVVGGGSIGGTLRRKTRVCQ